MKLWTKEYDEIGVIHWLWIDSNHSVKVEKSGGGDYFVTAFREGDCSGGEVEYFDTLAQAKRFAERIADTGEWTEYLQQ